MIAIQNNYPLDQLNTFGMKAEAPFFSVITDKKNCMDLTKNMPAHLPILILGGGSNMLFTNTIQNWVIKNEIKGIELIHEDDQNVYLKVGAGEVWHEFVLYCIANNYCGVENLSLIPGTVGAAPIQNIGAYGVEVKSVIEKVHFWDLETSTFRTFNNADCHFGYRDSVFKNVLKGKFIITEVEWKLSKMPNINISYGNIHDELQNMGITNPNIKNVSDAVIAIRQSKLPDPKVVGNAGSFFKNPEVKNELFESIKSTHADVPGYRLGEHYTKIPAAWLIEQCGWKGYREGDAGVHPKQPLVLVNYGNAKGAEIFNLSEKMIASVVAKFGITLEREVQMIG